MRVVLRDFDEDGKESASISDQAEDLWDVDEPERLVKLAINFPELLTHHEQKVWKLVRDNGCLWNGEEDETGTWRWQVSEESLMPERLSMYWEDFNKAAGGELHRFYLPRWPGMPVRVTSSIRLRMARY